MKAVVVLLSFALCGTCYWKAGRDENNCMQALETLKMPRGFLVEKA
jgi:hypothetical protein